VSGVEDIESIDRRETNCERVLYHHLVD